MVIIRGGGILGFNFNQLSRQIDHNFLIDTSVVLLLYKNAFCKYFCVTANYFSDGFIRFIISEENRNSSNSSLPDFSRLSRVPCHQDRPS